MNKEYQQSWISCYIYCDTTANEFLVKKIFPITQYALKNKLANQYFFIRYGDKYGFHIRLRFKGEINLLEYTLRPLLEKSFTNNRFTRYRPEIQRYGGVEAMLIAEKLFEASSNTALSFLKSSDYSDYERSLGFALQMNLSMLHSFGLHKDEAQDFFKHFTIKSNINGFKNNLNQQYASIIPTLSHMWSILDQNNSFEYEWFNEWIREVKIIEKDIKKVYTKHLLNPRYSKKLHIHNPLWYLYDSYLHMNNNRLGIYRIDELFLIYILNKFFKNL